MLSTTIQPAMQLLQGKPADMTMATAFQTGHGYTQTGTAASTNLNDTSDFVLGTQSVSTVTNGAGAANQIRNASTGPFNLTSRQIGLWVKVDDVSHLSQLVLYLFSGGGTSNLQTYKYYSGPANNTAQIQSGAWTFITINLGDIQSSGGTFDKTNVTGFQLRAVDDNTGNTVTVHYNGISHFADPSAYFPNGAVTISFDDSFASQYTYGRAYLDTYGYPGVAYTICGNIGGSGWMTLTQLQQLRDQNGWEIAAHASTLANHNTRFTNLSAADLELEFFNMQQWLVKNGFNGAGHMALPGGQFNAAVLEKAKKYFGSVRTIDGTMHETLRPSDIMKIRAISSISSFTGGVSAATVNAAIDTAVANKQWLFLVFHDIVTSAPAATTQCLQSDFQAIVDHIHSSGIAVRTVSGVIATIVGPPPAIPATTFAVGTVQLAGDLGGTSTSPIVVGTHLAAALPVAQGGTGQTALSSAVPQPAITAATASSGSSLVLARDDHGHPRYDFQPSDHGYLAWSFDPALAVNSTALATAGLLHVIKLHLPVAKNITGIDCYVVTAGSGLTSGQCFACAFQAGTLLGTTADQSTAWTSTGLKQMNLSGGPFAAAAGDVYVGFWYNGTTAPALARSAGSNVANSGYAAVSSRFGTANSGLTTAAPGTLGTISAEALAYWTGIR